MTSNIKNTAGTDLDSVFVALGSHTAASPTGIQVAGADLNTRYAGLATPGALPVASLQGIQSGGVDLKSIFAGSVFSPVLHTYTYNSSTQTDTVPTGASTVVIEVWGNTGGSGHGNNTIPSQGGGGGSGGYSRSSYSCSSQNGHTFSIVTQAGESLSNTTVNAGTFTGFTTMAAPPGGTGANATSGSGGNGGAAGAIGTGGSVTNVVGNAGNHGDPTGNGQGGFAVTGIYGTGNDGPIGSYNPAINLTGSGSVVTFYYT